MILHVFTLFLINLIFDTEGFNLITFLYNFSSGTLAS